MYCRIIVIDLKMETMEIVVGVGVCWFIIANYTSDMCMVFKF